jgi:hypothetical protein
MEKLGFNVDNVVSQALALVQEQSQCGEARRAAGRGR